jgi:hypothetical protein
VTGGSGIARLGLVQLSAWEALARDWPLVPDAQPHGDPPSLALCDRCVCGVGVIRTHDDLGNVYSYTDQEKLSLTVAHLRSAHTDIDPES